MDLTYFINGYAMRNVNAGYILDCYVKLNQVGMF